MLCVFCGHSLQTCPELGDQPALHSLRVRACVRACFRAHKLAGGWTYGRAGVQAHRQARCAGVQVYRCAGVQMCGRARASTRRCTRKPAHGSHHRNYHPTLCLGMPSRLRGIENCQLDHSTLEHSSIARKISCMSTCSPGLDTC